MEKIKKIHSNLQFFKNNTKKNEIPENPTFKVYGRRVLPNTSVKYDFPAKSYSPVKKDSPACDVVHTSLIP